MADIDFEDFQKEISNAETYLHPNRRLVGRMDETRRSNILHQFGRQPLQSRQKAAPPREPTITPSSDSPPNKYSDPMEREKLISRLLTDYKANNSRVSTTSASPSSSSSSSSSTSPRLIGRRTSTPSAASPSRGTSSFDSSARNEGGYDGRAAPRPTPPPALPPAPLAPSRQFDDDADYISDGGMSADSAEQGSRLRARSRSRSRSRSDDGSEDGSEDGVLFFASDLQELRLSFITSHPPIVSTAVMISACAELKASTKKMNAMGNDSITLIPTIPSGTMYGRGNSGDTLLKCKKAQNSMSWPTQ